MNSHEKSDAAEAQRYFRSRIEAVREALNDSDTLDSLMEDCLCVETRLAIDIQLSTGGPGDGFEIFCDVTTGEPLHGCHYFATWGFRKEVSLSNEELADVCAAYGIEDARVFLNRK